MSVRRARPADREPLLDLWERSVRATHDFLTESDITELRPLVADELSSEAIDWWVFDATGTVIGFLGFANDAIEGLFIDPEHRGRGVGTALVEHAQHLAVGTLRVDVNEQNDAARKFYEARGFVVVGRSPTDNAGRPFPLLHMSRIEKARDLDAQVVTLRDEAECQALGAFLVDRIYEFNARATGYYDAQVLAGCIRGETGEVIAGFDGYTWGGCCELSHIWVHEQHRGRGLGALLLRSAEAEATARGCAQVVLATHSFQAPEFYERMGYERKFTIEGRPQGHSDIIFVKLLGRNDDRP